MVKRVIVGFLAVLLIAAGLATGATAVWANQVFGSDGILAFDAGTITPDDGSGATIVDVDRFGATVPYLEEIGVTTLSVTTGERGDPSDTLFIGAGPTPDVDAYLKGTPYSVAIREGDSWVTRQVPGVSPAAPPRQQDLWLTNAVGSPAAIAIPDERPITLVVMHPAGLPSGPVTLSIDFTVPDAANYIAGLIAAAVILLLIGLILLFVAVRVLRKRGRHEFDPSAGAHAA